MRGNDTVVGWLEAQQRLSHALSDILLASKSITANRLAAKFFGIGSQDITAGIDHHGHLQALHSLSPRSPRMQPQNLLPDLRKPMKVVRSAASTDLPVFEADLSLDASRAD